MFGKLGAFACALMLAASPLSALAANTGTPGALSAEQRDAANKLTGALISAATGVPASSKQPVFEGQFAGVLESFGAAPDVTKAAITAAIARPGLPAAAVAALRSLLANIQGRALNGPQALGSLSSSGSPSFGGGGGSDYTP